MRSRLAVAMSALALLLSGCGSTAPPNDGTAVPPPPSEGSAPPPSPPPGTRVVPLHGTFTGNYSFLGTTADITVQVEVRWNVGPDDVHDPNAFTFTSGSYTFSESIPGVCGGSRTEGGPLTLFTSQSLTHGEPQDREDIVNVGMVDRRVTDGGLQLGLSSSFQVPNGAGGCDGGLSAGVGLCSLLFLQTAADKVQTDATCTVSASTWTGHLDQ